MHSLTKREPLLLLYCCCNHLTVHRYMRKVQDETLRLSTLAPYAARISEEEIGVCGYNVPPHTPIIHALGVASKNESIWKDVEA